MIYAAIAYLWVIAGFCKLLDYVRIAAKPKEKK